MSPKHQRSESHFIARIGWLRAAVLGANDGIISTSSLIAGVAASAASKDTILLTGVAALVAGALSMAAGEYVSVSAQSDTENADMERERQELVDFPEAETDELTHIYIERGLEPDLARQVAVQLMAKDALKAHARDELGLSDHMTAKPIQAALASAASFAAGAVLPIIVLLLVPHDLILMSVGVSALVFLAILGGIGARTGGSPLLKAIFRVTFWGAVAIAVTAGIGHLFGTAL